MGDLQPRIYDKPLKEIRTVKRPDLLVLIAIWEFLGTLGSLIGIAAIFVFAFPGVSSYAGPAEPGTIFGLSVGILLLLCSSSIAVAGGIGLLQGKGWGRILSIVNAALSLFRIPLGTIIGILVLIYLAKPDVREYFEGSRE